MAGLLFFFHKVARLAAQQLNIPTQQLSRLFDESTKTVQAHPSKNLNITQPSDGA